MDFPKYLHFPFYSLIVCVCVCVCVCVFKGRNWSFFILVSPVLHLMPASEQTLHKETLHKHPRREGRW